MTAPTTPHAGNRKHVTPDQAAPEVHCLKIDAQPMSDLLSGNKTCEVGNDDRGFAVSDYVHLVCAEVGRRIASSAISSAAIACLTAFAFCLTAPITPPPLRLPSVEAK